MYTYTGYFKTVVRYFKSMFNSLINVENLNLKIKIISYSDFPIFDIVYLYN